MLEQKQPYKKNDCISLLVDGVGEVVCRFQREEDGNYIVTVPNVIIPQMDGQGGVGIAFQPFMLSCEGDEFPIAKAKVVSHGPCSKQFRDYLVQKDSHIDLSGTL